MQEVMQDMEKYSPKMKALLKNIQELDEQDMAKTGRTYKHFIFSDVKAGGYGAKIIASALVASGKRLGYDNKLKVLSDEELLDTRGQNFFLLCSTAVYKDPINVKTKKAILGKFNQRPDNIYGDLARFIVMDSGFKEGIDLFDVKYVHIFEPQTSKADQKQVIGRGTRTCGQKGLEFHPTKGWPLMVYLYDVTIPRDFVDTMKANTLFQSYMLSKGIDLRLLSFADELERYAIVGSVDYELNKNIHRFEVDDDEVYFDIWANGGAKGKRKTPVPGDVLCDGKCGASRPTKDVPMGIPMFVTAYLALKREFPKGRVTRAFFCDLIAKDPQFCKACKDMYKDRVKFVQLHAVELVKAMKLRRYAPLTSSQRSSLFRFIFTIIPKPVKRNKKDEKVMFAPDEESEPDLVAPTPILTNTPKTPKTPMTPVSNDESMEDIEVTPPSPPSDRKSFIEMREFVRENYSQYAWPKVTMENMCGPPPQPAATRPSQIVQVPQPQPQRFQQQSSPQPQAFQQQPQPQRVQQSTPQPQAFQQQPQPQRVQQQSTPQPQAFQQQSTPQPQRAQQSTPQPQAFQQQPQPQRAQQSTPQPQAFQQQPQPQRLQQSSPQPQRVQQRAGADAISFSPTQEFMHNFFTPESSVKGMLAWHSVGTGKTCSAIATASASFEKEGYTILWVTRTTLKSDIWKNMFDQVCHLGLQEKMREGMNIPDAMEARMRLLSKAWSIRPMSYKQFSNLVAGNNALYQQLVKKNGERDPLRKTLLIIDEAHKLYGGTDLSSIERPDMNKLHAAIMKSYRLSGKDSVRLLIMTATPMTNDPMELVKLLNLLKEPNDQLPAKYDDFTDKYLGQDGAFSKQGSRKFLDDIAGHISYLNRERDARQFSQPVVIPLNVEMSSAKGMEDPLTISNGLKEQIAAIKAETEEIKNQLKEEKKQLANDKKTAKERCKSLKGEEKRNCLDQAEEEIRVMDRDFIDRKAEIDKELLAKKESVSGMRKDATKAAKAAKEDPSQLNTIMSKCVTSSRKKQTPKRDSNSDDESVDGRQVKI
jgi:superfamily II DNA or RNA helicase